MIKDSVSRKIFVVCNTALLILLVVITLYPEWYILCASFSEPGLLSMHKGLLLKPLGFTPSAYQLLSQNVMIYYGFINTLIVVVVGLVLNMTLTTLGAYFLSRKNVMWRDFIMFAIVFTMFFSGGLIPFYFTVKQLGIENSLLALIIPSALNTFNLIIMRTAFASVPESLEESAKIEGAGHLRIIWDIVLPLTLPTFSVIVLYYAVGHWNSWFNAVIFIRERTKFPLQLVLREILIQNSTESMLMGTDADEGSQMGELIKYALIIVSILPITVIYPFIQRFFVKGVMIGAVKG